MILHYVAHAGSKVPESSDPLASASQVAGTIGASHHPLAQDCLLNSGEG